MQNLTHLGITLNHGDLYCNVLNDLSTFQANELKNKTPCVHSTSVCPRVALCANRSMFLWQLIHGLRWLVLLKSHLIDWFLVRELVVFHGNAPETCREHSSAALAESIQAFTMIFPSLSSRLSWFLSPLGSIFPSLLFSRIKITFYCLSWLVWWA